MMWGAHSVWPYAAPPPARPGLVGLAWAPAAGGGVTYRVSDGSATAPLPGGLAAYLAARPAVEVGVMAVAALVSAAGDGLVADRDAVWSLARAGRLFDVGLLAGLVGAACPDARPGSAADPGADEAEAARVTCSALLFRADEAARDAGPARRPPLAGCGPLGLTLEVMAAAAAALPGSGVRVDPERRDAALTECERQRDEAALRLRQSGAGDDWLKFRSGQLVTTATGYPRTDQGRLERWLAAQTVALRRVHGLPVPMQLYGDGQQIDLEVEAWRREVPFSAALADWAAMTSAARLRQALSVAGPFAPEVETSPALRSRRPAFGWEGLRDGAKLFLPAAPSSRLLEVRLPDLELRALGFCLGHDSWLAAQFAAGEEPTGLVALRASGVGPGRFAKMATETPAQAARWLDLARAALKYLPLGVEPGALSWLCRDADGGRATRAEVRAVADAVAGLVPELAGYLADDTAERLALNLGVAVEDLEAATGRLRGDAALSRWLTDTLFERPGGPDPGKAAEQLLAALSPWWAGPTPSDGYPGGRWYELLAARPHASPAGRVAGRATAWEAMGTDHLAVADAARKRVAFEVAGAGLPLVGVGRESLLFEDPAARGTAGLKAILESAVGGMLGGVPLPAQVVG